MKTLALLLLATQAAFAQEPTAMGPEDPLAGWSNQDAFLRSPDNSFILMPSGRLQVDSYFFKRDDKPGASPAGSRMPPDTLLERRARLEAYGWIGSKVFFSIAGDFALGTPAAADPIAQSWIATTDDYVMVAPWHNLAMLQIGQFDAPFTFENRTSDKYFDFMERSITVRAFGINDNKEAGGMVHGILPNKAFYYSIGVFNGDGQNFRNVDNNADVMGRAWVAPLQLAQATGFEEAEVGGSFWVGSRGGNGLRLAPMTTQGGFTFLETKWTDPNKISTELHQHHDLREWALELNVPYRHKYGLRVEYVNKQQDLDEDNISMAAMGTQITDGHAKLDGWSMYVEAWAWLIGDDTILPEPGLQLPPRLKKFVNKPPRHGLMVAVRVDHLDTNITSSDPNNTLKDPAIGNTNVTAIDFGVNYWYSKRFRATFNYVANLIDGDSETVKSAKLTNGGNSDEHEFLFRIAVAL